MALSGSFNTNAYGNRYLTFSWSATQSTEYNESYISWSLKGAGGGTNYYMAAPFTVVIDGETVYYSETRIQLTDGKTVASGTKTIKHNTDGSRSFSVSASAAIYAFAVNTWGSGSWELTPIPRAAQIVSAPNFTDEDNPTITYSNTAGSVVSKIEACISFDGSADDIPYRSISTTGTSYTFNFTDEEREILWNGVLNGSTSRTVYFYLKTTIGSNTLYYNVPKTLTIIDAAPTISPTVRDQGTVSITLTGNTSKVIRGYNTMNAAVNATAYKGASIVSQSITCGSQVLSAGSGLLSNVESGVFTFTATDNRGQSVSKTVELELIPYVKPTIAQTAVGSLDAESNTVHIKLNTEGIGWLNSFGAVMNQLKIQYRVKSGYEDWGAWVTISEAEMAANNSYTAEATITGLDYQLTHTIQSRIVDSIYKDGIVTEEIVINVTPVFDWGKESFNFNVPIAIQEDPVGDWVIETGTEAMGSNGTWHWSKWKSGKAECYGCRNYGNMAITKAWGSVFESESFTQSLPSGLFSAAPDFISIHPYKAGGGMWVEMAVGEPTKSQTGSFYMVRGTSATVTQVYIAFNVIGRWK